LTDFCFTLKKIVAQLIKCITRSFSSFLPYFSAKKEEEEEEKGGENVPDYTFGNSGGMNYAYLVLPFLGNSYGFSP